MSSNYLITAPTADVVTLADVKTMLGITSSTDDALLTLMIKTVVAQIDPASGGWLGRALRTQTWELRLPGFDCDEIKLPYPVLTAVSSVKYDDADGVEQTVSSGSYRVFGLNDHSRASIAPVYNGSWPSARYDRESVRIRFVCGYALTPADLMPLPIKQAVALTVRHLRSLGERNLFLRSEDVPGVRARSWTVSDAAGAVITRAIDDLLWNYRVWGLP